MKKIVSLFVFSALMFADTALAHEGGHEHLCQEATRGREFGEHVSTHARQGHFNGQMNPGMHQGYSVCIE